MRRAFGERDAGADRRPEAGDLRVPRRRRLRLPRRRAGGGDAGDAGGQLAQRPGADRRLRRAVRRRAARARGDRLPAGAGDRANQRARLPARRCRRRCGSASSHRDEPSVRTTAGGYASAPSAREHIAKDLAADLVALLSSPARDRRRRRRVTAARRTSPCWCGRTATPPRSATRSTRSAIPAVINGAGSVFGTAPAREWLRLLEAIERPVLPPRARAAALTPFLGWTRGAGRDRGRGRLGGGPPAAARLGARCCACRASRRWRRRSRWSRGCPSGSSRAPTASATLTDLRHVGQLLHAAATTEQLGTTALAAWLRRRIAEAAQDTSDEDRSRRLESDAEAVQVLTIHRSKGLEFPIVYCPYLWEPTWITDESVPVAFHDPERGRRARRRRRAGGAGDFTRHKRQHLVEQRGEDLRLAYVALTRARHQAVVWWAGSSTSRHSALGRLLFARDEDGTRGLGGPPRALRRGRRPRGSRRSRRRRRAASASSGRRSALPVSWTRPRATRRRSSSAARFDRELDRGWRRTSFSDITAGAHEARVASEPEERGRRPTSRRRPCARPRRSRRDDALRATPSLLAGCPSGRSVGTFVHRVLEATDFAAAGPRRGAGRAGRGRAGAAPGRDRRSGGGGGGPARGDRDAARPRRAPPARSRREPIAWTSSTSSSRSWAATRRRRRSPSTRSPPCSRAAARADDPLAGYAERLGDPVLRRSVRGYVTGSIDLVARVRRALRGRRLQDELARRRPARS